MGVKIIRQPPQNYSNGVLNSSLVSVCSIYSSFLLLFRTSEEKGPELRKRKGEDCSRKISTNSCKKSELGFPLQPRF
ncbi:hypothetical protein Nepgr_006023 [Nepenthes gracilis]|uniref:Uncharacterized protein n=1 Tax=Nepenthes gracilis TaxID=150966 RepID=A0AAD3XGY4_NEPGR|nr:hypothetical protein Nepgr_006023 [Nepenthes gracilis]